MKKLTHFRKMMKSESGQGMTEYIIIVALIAIAAIGVVTIFGDNIRRLFGASVNALAGSDTANTGAVKAGQAQVKHSSLSSFAAHTTSDGTGH